MRGIAVAALFVAATAGATPCTYSTWTWDTRTKKAVDVREVTKDRRDLQPHESMKGCSLCSQDQIEIALPGIKPFRVCRLYSERIREALGATLSQGWPIQTVVGYRVGKTKGDTDSQGRRTEYSLHSFGLAIDVNDQHNGLYDDCHSFSPKCQLLRGGHWDPASAFSIRRDNPLYKALVSMGWKWGGEIAGKQKDFMHFSPTGY
jgi:hypothetical protein